MVLDVPRYKYLMDILERKHRHLSPLWGATLFEKGVLQNMYEYSNKGKHAFRIFLKDATTELLLELFHCAEDQFCSTKNKSKAAFSLDAEILALLSVAMEQKTISQEQVQDQLTDALMSHHKAHYKHKLNRCKAKLLVELVAKSHRECSLSEPLYPSFMTQSILTAFLHARSTSKEPLLVYLETMHKKLPVLADLKLDRDVILCSSYTTEEIVNARLSLSKHKFSSDTDFENIELFVCAAMCMQKYPPKLNRGNIKYNGDSISNCVEIAIQDFLNLVLYNPSTHKFDFDLLPPSVKPREELTKFYETQGFNITTCRSYSVQHRFFEMLCNHSFVSYRPGKTYEVFPNINNFVAILQYLLQLHCHNLGQLAQGLSQEGHQTIEVETLSSTNRTIKISCPSLGKLYLCSINFDNDTHGDLYLDDRKLAEQVLCKEATTNLWNVAVSRPVLGQEAQHWTPFIDFTTFMSDRVPSARELGTFHIQQRLPALVKLACLGVKNCPQSVVQMLLTVYKKYPSKSLGKFVLSFSSRTGCPPPSLSGKRATTLSHIACEIGCLKFLNNVNSSEMRVCDENGLVPIHLAVKNGHAKVVKHLLAWNESLKTVEVEAEISETDLEAEVEALANKGHILSSPKFSAASAMPADAQLATRKRKRSLVPLDLVPKGRQDIEIMLS